jgi:hypothetical protein
MVKKMLAFERVFLAYAALCGEALHTCNLLDLRPVELQRVIRRIVRVEGINWDE